MDEMMKKLFSDKDFRAAEKQKATAGSPDRKILQLMRDGIKLAFSAAGRNTSNFDDKNLKVMSPKLFSIGTDVNNDKNGDDDDPVSLARGKIDFRSPIQNIWMRVRCYDTLTIPIKGFHVFT